MKTEDQTFKILLLLKKFFDTNYLELPAVVYKDPSTIAICNNNKVCKCLHSNLINILTSM